MTIYLLGDSITKGIQYDEKRERYRQMPGRFADLVQKETGVTIENYGRFGSTIGKGIRLLDRRLGQIPEGSLVLTEFGGNDCDYDWDEVAASPRAEHLPHTPKRLFPVLYETMILEILDAGKKAAVMTLPPLDPDRFFEWISAGRDKTAILTFLGGDRGRLYRWHQSYNAAVLQAAEAFGLPVLDVRRAFLRQPDYRALLGIDGIHPNEKGHRLIASVVSRFLETSGIAESSRGKSHPGDAATENPARAGSGLAGPDLPGETVDGIENVVDQAVGKAS